MLPALLATFIELTWERQEPARRGGTMRSDGENINPGTLQKYFFSKLEFPV